MKCVIIEIIKRVGDNSIRTKCYEEVTRDEAGYEYGLRN